MNLNAEETITTPSINDFGSGYCENSSVSTMKRKLANWVVKSNISRSSVSELLKILRTVPALNDLPSTATALLGTPRFLPVSACPPGEYYHFGVQEGILYALRHLTENILPSVIEILVNVDGLPVCKSSLSQFWPILGTCANIDSCKPFLIGCYYHCRRKPESCNIFLRPFVNEIKQLVANGFLFGSKKVFVSVVGFICDAPARAFITRIKSHAGYNGCGKCVQRGEFATHVVFPQSDCVLRNDQSFRLRADEDHHLDGERSVLEEVPGLKMVEHFPFEFMHLACLGVMKKLLLLWLRGSLCHRLPQSMVEQISTYLQEMRPFIPSEFARKPRPLNEIDRWKATELRQFLLYTAPVVLQKFFKGKFKSFYRHFLTLFCGMRILCNEIDYVVKNNYASQLLKYFVDNFHSLYGLPSLSYNIHGLIHVCNDALMFGTLDKYSAFQFENYLGKIKRLIKNSDKPLKQLIHRTVEERNVPFFGSSAESKFPMPQLQHDNGPLISGCTGPQYKKVCFQKFTISASEKDNCCLLNDGSIGVVRNFAQYKSTIVSIGQKFNNVANFFSEPCDSNQVGVYKVRSLSGLVCWPLDSIIAKAMKLPLGDGIFYVAVLLNTKEVNCLSC